jgi:hypothetical protein
MSKDYSRHSKKIMDKEGGVCLIPDSSRKHARKVSVLRVDKDGVLQKTIQNNSNNIYCKYGTSDVSIPQQTSWKPYFNKMLMTKGNETRLDEGKYLNITVTRLGYEKCSFYPFGSEECQFDIRGEVPLVIKNESESVETKGFIRSDEYGLAVIDYLPVEIEAPYHVHSTFEAKLLSK